MNWYKNMRISTKLIASFTVVAIIAGIVGLVGTSNLKKMNEDYSFNFDNYGVPLENIGIVGIYFHKNRTLLKDIILEDNRTLQDEAIATLKSNDERIKKEIGIFSESTETQEMKDMIANLSSLVAEYNKVRDNIISLQISGQTEAVNQALDQAAEITFATDGQIREILTAKNERGQELKAKIQSDATRSVALMIVIIVVAVALALFLGILISRSISRPINKLVTSAERIADGDLDVTVDVNSKDELGKLSNAFNHMLDNLNEVIGNITLAAEQVSTGAKQMSESSMVLSRGATEQASSVEELTASLEEITMKIDENSKGAIEAADFSNKTKEDAIKGNEQMKNMLVAMDEINASSDSISKIIKVIDEIAFQTNILALNAAVEAARAGQHGKGFAVVAEEVRNLAARSANAAKETAEMIEGSIRKVDEGMKIANQTADSLQLIVKTITEINALATSAAANAQEQAVGVNQINQGLAQVSQVIQTNSATSEENAAASEQLTSQAEMMQHQVRRFNLSKKSKYKFEQVKGWGDTKQLNLDQSLATKMSEMDAVTLDSKGFGKY